MLFTINSLKRVFPKFTGNIDNDNLINKVITDSRKNVEQSLFIPIEGERFDGHDFLKQAIENGAIATVWNKQKQVPDFVPDHFPVFFVSNTIDALQQLATHYRQLINPTVVGITGSNGKTTTKDILAAILRTTFKTHATKGNFNNDIGLPLTILSMSRDTEILVVEMGMNDFKEIERLSHVAQPDYAIITNIGESHIEHLGSREGIAQAKLEIVEGLKESGLLIVDGDEPLLNSIHGKKNVIKCGFGNTNNNVISNVELIETGTQFIVNNVHTYNIPLFGKHHALNASYAIALAQFVGVQEENIVNGLMSLDHTSMRFQFLQSTHEATLINDAYNASPTSMIGAIDVIKQFDSYKEKIVVLGDILELGTYAEQFHLSVAEHIKEPITKLFTYGNNAHLISQYVSKHEYQIECQHFTDKETLITHLNDILNKNMIVLFKASRGMALESIVEKLI